MEKQFWQACKDGKAEEVQSLLQNSQFNINWQLDPEALCIYIGTV